MAVIQDEAIVLRRLDYSETSQILVFFTRGHGPQRLMAKGVKRGTKKKFAPGLDLLERGRLAFIAGPAGGSGLGTMTEWRQSEAYLGLRDDLRRLYAAQYAAEITTAMTAEADPHPELFDALADTLAALHTGGDPLPLLVGYQRILLKVVGWWPDLDRCVLCDRPAPAHRAGFFSAQQGGLVCRGCARRLPEKKIVPAAVLDTLRAGLCTGPDIARVFDLLDYTISQHIGRPPSLARFLQE